MGSDIALARRQRRGAIDDRLQRQIMAQHVVVGDVVPAAAQRVGALREQSTQIMFDAGGPTAVGEHPGNGASQSDPFIGLPRQQHAGITADIATIEGCFDRAAPGLA